MIAKWRRSSAAGPLRGLSGSGLRQSPGHPENSLVTPLFSTLFSTHDVPVQPNPPFLGVYNGTLGDGFGHRFERISNADLTFAKSA
jgi:hypothetical protein